MNTLETGLARQQANARAGLNGCHNRPPFAEPHVLSRDCQYQRDPMGQGSKDPKCAGCRWKETTQ